MKICVVTTSHNRYDVRIFQKECVSLAKKYDVTLLCADDIKDEIKDNVKIKSLNVKKKKRFTRYFILPKKMKKLCIEQNADVYHFHDPELLGLAYYMKKHGKKVVFDSHEDFLNYIDERKWIPKLLRKPIKKIFSKHEIKVLKNIDTVITVTNHIYNDLKKINNNTYMITNYPIVIDEKIDNKHENNILCFAGGISSLWSHHNIIKAIKDLDVVYRLAGPTHGDYFNTLKDIDGFNKVEYVGKISSKEVQNLYGNSGIGMALSGYSVNTACKYGTIGNTKIFEYMYNKLPIIGTDFELWKEMFDKKCMICVNPNNVVEIKDAIMYLINNPKQAKKMGEIGHKLVVEKYNWSTQEKELFKVYKELE